MSTTVTVKCHAYPVLVERIECPYNNPNKVLEIGRVAPGETKDFILYSDHQFRITELPQEIKSEVP